MFHTLSINSFSYVLTLKERLSLPANNMLTLFAMRTSHVLLKMEKLLTVKIWFKSKFGSC